VLLATKSLLSCLKLKGRCLLLLLLYSIVIINILFLLSFVIFDILLVLNVVIFNPSSSSSSLISIGLALL